MRCILRTLAAAVLACGFAAQTSPAQSAALDGNRPTRVPVTIALVDSLPGGSDSFEIVRRPQGEPRDVILLRPEADAETLTDAVRGLLLVRGQDGDTASIDGTFRFPTNHGKRARPAFPWARRVLADLHAAETRDVAGVGPVRTVVIWLPPQRNASTR